MTAFLHDLAGAGGFLGLAGAIAGVAAAGFLRGFVGFGAALIAIPVLSIVYSPTIAVVIAFVSGLPTVLQMLPMAVRHAERPFVAPIAVAAFLAAPLGTYVLATADPELMRIAIAVVVLAMCGFLQAGWRLARRPGLATLAAAGAVAGLIQGAAGVGGPPAVAMALSRPGAAATQRANVIAAVTALSLATALPLWSLGLFTREALVLSLIYVPIHFFAAILGARNFHIGGQRWYRAIAMATMVAVGLFTLAFALKGYVFG